jgi:hypothetical protein
MAEHDYHPEIQYYGMSGFEVQYQGPKKIKASPLLRVMYSYRHLDPLQVDIKCVSVNRAIPPGAQAAPLLARRLLPPVEISATATNATGARIRKAWGHPSLNLMESSAPCAGTTTRISPCSTKMPCAWCSSTPACTMSCCLWSERAWVAGRDTATTKRWTT